MKASRTPLKTNKLYVNPNAKLTGDFKKYLLREGLSTQTANGYYRDTMSFISWFEDGSNSERLEVENCTHNDLIAYVKHLRTTKTPKSVQLEINALKHFFRWQIGTEKRADNPAQTITIKGVVRRKLYHIFKPEELEQLYESFNVPEKTRANQNLTNRSHEHPQKKQRDVSNQNWFKAQLLAAKRNRVMLGLMIWQGVNTTELSRLKTKDLKLREGKIFIGGTRRSNERTLKLESTQIMDLMEYTLQVRQEILKLAKLEADPTDRLFFGIEGSSNFSGMMQKFMQKVRNQYPKVTSAKQLRASVITGWLKQYNLRQVQYMAGHRYVSSTEAYLVNDLEGLSEDIAKFHPL